MEPRSDRAELVKAAKLIVWDEAPMMSRQYKDLCRHRAILTPTNDEVDKINDYMLSQLPCNMFDHLLLCSTNFLHVTKEKDLHMLSGEEKVYLSSDSIIPSDVDIEENVVYPAEFLNSVKVAGLPIHCLKLKVGAPIMCLRNMDVADGLCNGTRLIVTQLLPHVIECRIITGNNIAGYPVWIPRMFVTPLDTKFPFRMRRR
ncbi:BnaC09g15140D [Brassica napus]|uniref:BnaC09g15140D protein n=1 Tax=Brassica napus TaxID=3708 RepID=A0A078H079_BRANA|nr:BnaC09g15140D [Brassica napus]